MKPLLLISALFILIVSNVNAKIYYVSTTGNNSNSGLTEALAWKTITYAASVSSPVISGDIIYVKAGNYGPEYVSFQKSGSASSPIIFEGYRTTPGDAPNLNFKMGDALNASIMPLLDGGNRALSKVAFNLPGRSYITLRNFQITNYGYGVNTGNASYLTLDNIITMYTGDVTADYSGRGIQFGSWGSSVSNYNTISNCIVVNSAAEGLSINGNYNTVTNCKVYCNQGATVEEATDYYLIVCGSNNTITGCYVNRMGNLAHYGHGIGVKYDSQNNVFDNCMSINMAEDYFVRHRGAKYNTFKNCKALYGYAFVFRDGASHNTFIRCVSDSAQAGLRILDTSEDGGAQYAGRHNVFKNCIIKNARIGVLFDSYDQVSPADSNTIANCTFDDIEYLIYCNRANSENKMINCIISNTDNLKAGSYPLLFSFTYTNFYNNKFAAQSGTGNTSLNPMYVTAGKDYHLQSGSLCKDAGTALTYINDDFDGNPRPQGTSHDMGAYEYQTGGPAFSASITSKNVICNGENNGTATVTPSGGKPPYTYTWGNGQTTAVSTGLGAGSYSITVSDATTAVKTLSVVITQPLILTSSIASQANVSCNGGSNGSVTVTPAGGTAGYVYLWSPSNQTTATASGLTAATYSVKITDANACTTTRVLTISQPSSVLTSSLVSQTNVSCNGGNNGSATVAAAGGTAGYTYLWSPSNQTAAGATGLSVNNYTVKITDANGCTANSTVAITQSADITSTITTQKNVSCNGESNGSVTITPSGGTGPYTYLWSPSSQTTATASGLSAGTYMLAISDSKGCKKNRTVAITEPNHALVSDLNVTNASFCSAKDGKIVASVTGGTPNYSYAWSTSPVQITNTASGLAPGSYSVVISDANGCSTASTASVSCNTTTDTDNDSGRESQFNVFPNPATGPFNVVISSPRIGNEVLVVVRNLLGEEFYSKVFVVSNSDQVIAVDYSGSLTSGVYMVIATSNDSIFEKKIVIQ